MSILRRTIQKWKLREKLASLFENRFTNCPLIVIYPVFDANCNANRNNKVEQKQSSY
jgi:hypothetical protein